MLQLYAAIWRVSWRGQIGLVILSVAVAALAAAPLKFQRDIVNLLSHPPFETRQLYVLGTEMMIVILLSLGFKWAMGYFGGVLGDDVIRQIRRRLLTAAEQAPQGELTGRMGTLSTAISAEAEELGKFAGSALAEPVMQVGTLISVIGFIAMNQPRLGLLALLMIAPQVVIVVLTQRQVNRLVAERVKVLRASTDMLGARQLSELTAEIGRDFDRIFAIRKSMYFVKTSTKFVLSAINGVGTVAVLVLGGLLVLKGSTDVGTVVAATLGLSRIQGPTAYMIAFFRQVSANRVKFDLLRTVFPR